jgi:hypothetical protein
LACGSLTTSSFTPCWAAAAAAARGVRLTPSMQGEAAFLLEATILWCARQLSASHKMSSVHREFLLGLRGHLKKGNITYA